MKKIDHREITKELEWSFFDLLAGQGLPILLQDWVFVRNKIQEILRIKQREFHFFEVITPILGSEQMYNTSGHLSHYSDYMFPALEKSSEIFRLRPMTCPHHCLVYRKNLRSYRNLPFRLCENSILHRYESSGSLKGLERVRWMELADHHIFVQEENLYEEVKNNFRFVISFLKIFCFEFDRISCSFHDAKNVEKYHADERIWIFSENLLAQVLEELKVTYFIQKGEAAFYGPKIDFEIKTVDGKYATVATIQIDFLLPKKFNLNYIDKENVLRTPVLIHQSPFGTYQRFISLLLEKNKGKLPFWLSPLQIVLLPLNDQEITKKYVLSLHEELIRNNLRSAIWSDKSLNYLIKKVHAKRVPYYIVIGKKELETGKINLSETNQIKIGFPCDWKSLLEKLNKENVVIF